VQVPRDGHHAGADAQFAVPQFFHRLISGAP
jgi:hypothetical protein